MIKCFVLWFSLFLFSLSIASTDFVILVTSYNNEKWCEKNLDSIFSQDYKSFRVIYIDDCSTDNTVRRVSLYIKEHDVGDKIQLIRNKKRQYKMSNMYYAIHKLNDNDVVVELDGDDFLANPLVLSKLDKIYSEGETWFTYGQFKSLSNNKTCCWNNDMPKRIVKANLFRKYPHLPSHLRTFYAGLFKKIKEEDLKFKGEFLRMSPDVAIALPMIEMASKHYKFVKDTLLIYNDRNDINEHKVNHRYQLNLSKIIRRRSKYTSVDKL